MNTTHPLLNLAVLAELLERLDRSTRSVDADQYRTVSLRLAQELEATETSGAVHALLQTHPAAAAVYENLHYAQAGLCRSPLEAGLAAEQSAREAIANAMRDLA
jgi:hypothetical protein